MVAGLLLAAGAGTRLGRPKASVSFAGKLLVQRAIDTLAAGGCAPVHVVVGAAPVDVPDVVVVSNEDWPSGLASSLRAGLQSLPAEADSVVVALVDQPLIGPPVVERLRAARARGAQLAVATYHGRRGNPVLLARTLWPAVVSAAHDDVGARAYIEQHPDDVVPVECGDIADPADVDTADDLRNLEARWYHE